MSGVRVTPEVLTTPLDGGGAVLFDVEARTTFRLNETGAAIWRQLCEGSDPGAIAERLVRDYAIDADQASRSVDALCSELLRAKLIVESEA